MTAVSSHPPRASTLSDLDLEYGRDMVFQGSAGTELGGAGGAFCNPDRADL